MQKPVLALVCLISGCWLTAYVCFVLAPNTAWAQDSKLKGAAKSAKGKKPVNTTSLDLKANEIQSAFIKNAEDLASDYYDARDYEKARILLKSIQALKPDHPNLDAKLKRLDEESISSNELDVEVNTSHGWEPAGIIVAEGKPIRIKAEGDYKFSISGQLGPAGIPAAKTPLDLVGELPVGALIGIVMNPDRSATNDKDKDKKKDRPFLIGEGCDFTPPRDGHLFLRVNSPPENKNTGKIKVQISGTLKKLK